MASAVDMARELTTHELHELQLSDEWTAAEIDQIPGPVVTQLIGLSTNILIREDFSAPCGTHIDPAQYKVYSGSSFPAGEYLRESQDDDSQSSQAVQPAAGSSAESPEDNPRFPVRTNVAEYLPKKTAQEPQSATIPISARTRSEYRQVSSYDKIDKPRRSAARATVRLRQLSKTAVRPSRLNNLSGSAV